jgi:trehalose/maltose transport system substrate-binding protein
MGIEYKLCKSAVNAWGEKNGHTVKTINTPNSSNERLALYQQMLGAESSDIDVYQIDVIWPGLLGDHFIDLRPHFKDEIEDFFQNVIENNLLSEKLVAIPWYIDGGLLYYRKDLLEKYRKEVPTTWSELRETASSIQKEENKEKGTDNKLWGYVFQGRAYEGLTCNALEWVSSFGGGTIVSEQGEVTVQNPQTVKALKEAASWVGEISPKGVLNYSEEEARGIFQSGRSIFMRNWPYAYSLANSDSSPVKGKVGLALLPKGSNDKGRHTSTLGGYGLAVSKYSEHPKLAVDLVRYLTSQKELKRRFLEANYNPTRKSVYEDQDVKKSSEHVELLKKTFLNSVNRPARQTKQKYNRVSSEFWNSVYRILSASSEVEPEVKSLERKLKRISRNGNW